MTALIGTLATLAVVVAGCGLICGREMWRRQEQIDRER